MTDVKPADPESFDDYETTSIEEKSQKQEKKFSTTKTKGWIGNLFVESVLVGTKPMFLCKKESSMSLRENVEIEEKIFCPLSPEECGYYPYSFDSEEQIQSLYVD